MWKIGELKVRFLSLSSLQTSRGGFLLAESALFTLSSLLFAADSGALRFAIAFFPSLYASLTFVFRSFYPSFSLQAGVLRRLRRLSTRCPELSSNILVLLLDSVEEPDASTVGTGAKVLSPVDADSGGGSQASALRQQENFSKEHAAVALVAAKKRSVSTRTSSSLEHRAINERLPRNEESSAKVFHHLPSAGRVSNCAARWPVFASTFRRTPNLEGVAADYRSWRIESSPSAHSSEISASNGLWNGSKASFSIPRWSSTTRG